MDRIQARTDINRRPDGGIYNALADATLPDGLQQREDRTQQRWWILSIVFAVLIVLWAAVALAAGRPSLAILSPAAQASLEVTLAIARLFGALVLFLFPGGTLQRRLRWVAGGFVILALGGLAFGYLPPVIGVTLNLNTSMYAWLLMSSLAGFLFAIGLAPRESPRFTRGWMLVSLIALVALSVGILLTRHLLPPLADGSASGMQTPRGGVPLDWLTPWHWFLTIVPLVLSCVALAGTVRGVREGSLQRWLVVAMIVLAGSQLHSMLWPSPYSPDLTSADVLRSAFAVVVTIGGALQLRRIASERAALLAVTQEHARHLTELGILKANFTAMVAHELSAPIAAINSLVDMLEAKELDREHVRAAIKTETGVLASLVADVQQVATVEREDFVVRSRRILLKGLVADAATFARTLPGNHPIVEAIDVDACVRADQERISQVLRNLLTNSAKYSPSGAPIELRATRAGDGVCIEVADEGPGISPGDMERIFEKFGRGRDREGGNVPGVGLGLYLSRRIIQAHGSELTVRSRPGAGSVFGFELEIVPEQPAVLPLASEGSRVLLVDDHAAFRQPLAALLRMNEGIASVVEAGTVATARPLLKDVDIALIDLHLPDGSGVDLIREIHSVNPGAPAIVLTATLNRQQLATAVEAGAVGVLHKTASLDEIVDAVRRASAGASLLSQSEIIELLRMAGEQREEEYAVRAALEQLTPREREVLQVLAEGLSDKEIAERLHISTATARTHVVRIISKLGVHSRLQAVMLAARHGSVKVS